MGGPNVFTRLQPHLPYFHRGFIDVDKLAKLTGISRNKVRDALYNNARSSRQRLVEQLDDSHYFYLPAETRRPKPGPAKVTALRGTRWLDLSELAVNPDVAGAIVSAFHAAAEDAAQRIEARAAAVAGSPQLQVSVVVPVASAEVPA